MKTLKIIVLMLLTANLIFAQSTTTTGVDAGQSGNNSSYFGYQAGMSSSAAQCTYVGANAGKNTIPNSYNNTAIGYGALENPTGSYCSGNVAIGVGAGQTHNSGRDNLFIGAYTGGTGGSENVLIGGSAGRNFTSGASNLAIGRSALGQATTATRNIAIGEQAGSSLQTGVGNIFIGRKAGTGLTNINYQLYVGNAGFGPLVYGDLQTKQLAIGTSDLPIDTDGTPFTLAVNGRTITEEVQVKLKVNWPDYVFAEDYDLMTLTDLETTIKTLGHLPGVPSAEEVEENGHALGKMDAILLEKVEELTLHLIDMSKDIERLEKIEEQLRKENETLKK